MPFEIGMVGYHRAWEQTAKPGDYCWPILQEFYLPLFEARHFEMFHFIYGYEDSIGARWEHDQCVERGFGRRYLGRAFSEAVLSSLAAHT